MTENQKIISIDRNKLGDSPAHNSEAEDIMFQFIQQAATAGTWPSLPLGGIEANADLYTDGFNRMSFLSPTHEGIIELITSGLATKEVVDGKEVITLTNRFKNYYEKLIR